MRTNVMRRSAVTLVEVLVVVAIIGVAVGITIPAVTAARESTRRASCTQRMGQLVLAVQNYHAANGTYPPGRFLGRYGSGPNSTAWSWMALSLPFLEEHAIYDAGQIPVSTLEDSATVSQHVKSFICPAAAGDYSQPTVRAGNLIGFAVGQTTYKGVSGANWGADGSLRQWSVRTRFRNQGANGSYDGLGEGDGILWRSDMERRMTQKKIRDGASKTFLIGEDLPRYNIWSSWPYSNNAYGTCAIPPNHVPEDRAWQYESYSFRSDHRGGLNFALADGSVRFVSDSVDGTTYRAMATRSGREVTVLR